MCAVTGNTTISQKGDGDMTKAKKISLCNVKQKRTNNIAKGFQTYNNQSITIVMAATEAKAT